MRADLICSQNQLTLQSAPVQTLLNQTVLSSTQDNNLEVDDAYQAGLNVVFGQDILEQIQKEVNSFSYSAMGVEHQDVIDSLVRDLHMNRTNSHPAVFSLEL